MWQLSEHQDANYSLWPCGITSASFWLSPFCVCVWSSKWTRNENKRQRDQQEKHKEIGGMILMRSSPRYVMQIWNHEKAKRKETPRKDRGREDYKIRGSSDLLRISRVHLICQIYFTHILFMGKWWVAINAYAEAWGYSNPSSMRYFTPFTIILWLNHFPHTIFPIQSRLEATPARTG